MADFLQGGGNTGALMRAQDWSQSPLGPPHAWPHSLRTVVALLLQSQFPMFVAWGEQLGFLYNDPYAEILGAKHPRALGRRFYDIWSEIWPDISPLIDAAMLGQATYREDLPLLMNRKGYDEQTWFTFSYSPVQDESGKVGGMFCAVQETTGRVLAEVTNGGIRGREIAGPIEASATNGGVDVEITKVPETGVKLETTNGGIKLRLPTDAKASISARIVNGGIDTEGFSIQSSGENSRRRLDGDLNGGGPRIQLEGTNGGIQIRPR